MKSEQWKATSTWSGESCMSASRTFLKLGVWLTELSTANRKASATSTTTSVGGSGSVSGASPLQWIVEKPACTRRRRLNELTSRPHQLAMVNGHRGYRCFYEKKRKKHPSEWRCKSMDTEMCTVLCRCRCRKKRRLHTWIAFFLICDLASCSTECGVGSYRDGDSCKDCTSGMDCSINSLTNVTLATIHLRAGWWRASAQSAEVKRCFPRYACRPPFQIHLGHYGDNLCSTGYSQALCGVCERSYYRARGKCYRCRSLWRTWNVILVVVSSLIVATIVAIITCLALTKLGTCIRLLCAAGIIVYNKLLDMPPDEEKGVEPNGAEHFQNADTEAIARNCFRCAVVKQLASIFSIFSTLPKVIAMTYPDSYEVVLMFASFVNLDALNIAPTSCLIRVTILYELLVSTLTPLFIIAVIASILGVRVLCAYHERIAAVTIGVHLSMLTVYCTYVSATVAIFRALRPCRQFDDSYKGSRRYLHDDYSTPCNSMRHTITMILASINVAVWPVGVPLCFFMIIWRHRHIMRDEVQRKSSMNVQFLRILWGTYKPQFYLWDIFDLMRRLVLTAFVLLHAPGKSMLQAILGMLVSLVAIKIYRDSRPFRNVANNYVAEVTQWSTFCAFFALHLFDLSQERSSSLGRIVSTCILIMTCVSPLIAVAVYGRAFAAADAIRPNITASGESDVQQHVSARFASSQKIQLIDVFSSSESMNISSQSVPTNYAEESDFDLEYYASDSDEERKGTYRETELPVDKIPHEPSMMSPSHVLRQSKFMSPSASYLMHVLATPTRTAISDMPSFSESRHTPRPTASKEDSSVNHTSRFY